MVELDFRSHDGLYDLLQAEDRGRKNNASTRVVDVEQGDVVSNTIRHNSKTLRRSSRSKTKVAASSLTSEIEYFVDDPQDIMNINVFRSDPQVF
jgi:hypothetical protein